MKKTWIAAHAVWVVLLLASPAAWAGNTARIEQAGNGSFTILTQTKKKTSEITLHNIAPHQTEILLPFIANDRFVKKGQLRRAGCDVGPAAKRGANNNALIYQSGFGNGATVKQTGTDNQAFAIQAGNNNKSYIVQRGDGHMAETVQAGNDNTAVILQRC